MKDKSFEEAVRPLMKWLCENKSPHTRIIVANNTAEVVEGSQVFNTDEYITD